MKFYAADTDTASAADTADAAASTIEPGDWAADVLKVMKTDTGAQPAETKVETTPAPETKVETRKETIPDKLFEKKEELPKETKSEIDGIEEPQFRSDKSKADWGKIKSYAKQQEELARAHESKVKELTAQVESAKEGSKREADLQAKLEAAQKTMDEYKGIVQKVNIDLDPDFRSTYVDGRMKLIAEAKKIAEDSGVNPSTIETALHLKGKARTDALREAASEFSPFDTSRMASVIQTLDRLDAEAQEKRGNPQEYFKQQDQALREKQEASQKQYVEQATRAYRNAESKLSDELIILRKLEGDEHKDWNSKGEDIRKQSREFWETNNDPQRAAELVIKGFATERYERAFVDMRGERDDWKSKAEKFEKELEGLYSTGPKLGAQSTTVKDGKPSDWAEEVAAKMQGR